MSEHARRIRQQRDHVARGLRQGRLHTPEGLDLARQGACFVSLHGGDRYRVPRAGDRSTQACLQRLELADLLIPLSLWADDAEPEEMVACAGCQLTVHEAWTLPNGESPGVCPVCAYIDTAPEKTHGD